MEYQLIAVPDGGVIATEQPSENRVLLQVDDSVFASLAHLLDGSRADRAAGIIAFSNAIDYPVGSVGAIIKQILVTGGGGGGTPGASAYVHIRFSNDGGATFTGNAGQDPGSWLGIYTDASPTASTTVGAYTWVPIRGATGAAGANASLLALSATAQAFTFNSSNAAQPPSQSITLTATLQNLTGTIVWAANAYDDAGTLTGPVTLSGTGSSRTLDVGTFGAAARVIVTATLGGFSDSMTLVRLRDGATGAAGVTAILTNEVHSIGTAPDGTGGDYTGAGGEFQLFSGTTRVLAGVAYSVVSQSNVTVAINPSSGLYTVSNLTADTGTAVLRATWGGTTFDKTYTITRSKTGQPGASAFNWVTRGGVSAFGGNAVKSGGTEGWNADAYSVERMVGACFASFRAGQTNKQLMVALNGDPATDSNYTSLDYAWYCDRDGTCLIFESGVFVGGFGAYNVQTVFSILYDNESVIYIKDGTAVRTATTVPGRSFYLDTSFNDVGGAINSVVFVPAGAKGPQGPTGNQGLQGPPGANGQSQYLHTAYASNSDGTAGFNFTSGDYIGIYVDNNPVDSTNPASYSWKLFRGAQGPAGTQGIPGTPGSNGLTPYLHLKYSNDGGLSFTGSEGEAPGSWLGQYWDFTPADSTNPASYTWSKIAGENGAGAFTWVTTGGATGVGSTLTKTSGSGGWNAQGYSAEAYIGGAVVNGRIAGAGIFGLNVDPATDESWETIDYAWYHDGNGLVYILESGAFAAGPFSGGSSSTRFSIRYDNATVQYTRDGTVVRTVAAASGLRFHLDSSLSAPGTQLLDVSFGPAGARGNDGSNGTPGTSVYTATIYRQDASAPATPSGGSFNFGTGVLTPPAGWSASQPAVSTTPTYSSVGTFTTTTAGGTATNATWSTPQLVAQVGVSGPASPGVSPAAITTTTGGATSIAGIQFRTDGSIWKRTGLNPSGFTSSPLKWFNPVGGTPGTGYWIRFGAATVVNYAGLGTVTGANTAPLSLGSARQITLSGTGSDATIPYSISSDSAGENVVSSGSISLTVEAEP